MNIADFVAKIKESGEMEKLAGQGDAAATVPQDEEELSKVAEDLKYSGKLFGHYVVEGMLEKLAQEPIPAQGAAPSSQANEANDSGSMFKRIADKIMTNQGHESPGTTPSVPGADPLVTAETTQPKQVAKPNPDEKTG
jgi:hypothetical protein